MPKATNITIQGLQTVLEGIATPNHALFVFTGSRAIPSLRDIASQTLRHEWEGLLRRLPVQEMIPFIGEDVVFDFYIQFLTPFLPNGAYLDDINCKCQILIDKWDVKTKCVPFDMLTKYAEQQLRSAYVEGVLSADGPGMRMCVHSEKFDEFLAMFFKFNGIPSAMDTKEKHCSIS